MQRSHTTKERSRILQGPRRLGRVAVSARGTYDAHNLGGGGRQCDVQHGDHSRAVTSRSRACSGAHTHEVPRQRACVVMCGYMGKRESLITPVREEVEPTDMRVAAREGHSVCIIGHQSFRGVVCCKPDGPTFDYVLRVDLLRLAPVKFNNGLASRRLMRLCMIRTPPPPNCFANSG